MLRVSESFTGRIEGGQDGKGSGKGTAVDKCNEPVADGVAR